MDLVFNSFQNNYSIDVPISTNKIQLTPTFNSYSTVSINGIGVNSGIPSFPISLKPGINEIEIVLMASTNLINTYNISINRLIPSSNNLLSSLSIDGYEISPIFSPNIKSYKTKNFIKEKSVTISLESEHPGAKISVNGNIINQNAPFIIPTSIGTNIISIWVTSPDKSTNQYSVELTKLIESHLRIFTTALSYTGNLGGKEGADQKCNQDPKHPGDGSFYKALIISNPPGNKLNRIACQSPNCKNQMHNLDWVFHPFTNYRTLNNSNILFNTNSAGIITPESFLNIDPESPNLFWTGLESDWTKSNQNCDDWTNDSEFNFGVIGKFNSLNSEFINHSLSSCNLPKKIICVEQ